ncbi:uncharacterized protein [Diadema antillarum]|uniref:uncharacterized protein n=1 Tax=Diadema antillarum TaxID=105358 RepID=UPI003A8B5665
MEFFSITDPSDWPASVPGLKTIDTLLRCGICYEYFDIAMMIPKCSHNYCSICIRRYLNYKNLCPTCNTPVEAAALCNNRSLDELVSNFKAVRQHILKLCQEDAKRQNGKEASDGSPTKDQDKASKKGGKKRAKYSPQILQQAVEGEDGDFVSDFRQRPDDSQTPKRKMQKRSNYQSTRSKIASYASDSMSSPERPKALGDRPQDVGDASDSSLTGVHSSSSSSSTSALNRSNEENIDPSYQPPPDADDSDGDVEHGDAVTMATPAKSSPSTSRNYASEPPSAKKSATSGAHSERVECPVCGVPILVKNVNTHLDFCLKKSTENEVKKSAPKRKPLPKIVSSVMSERELRKKLKEHGLNTQGNKPVLGRRLQEFTLMYNAQCDAENPMPVEAIVKDFNRMDKLKSQPTTTQADQRLKVSRSQSEEEVTRSQQDYLKSHGSQFHELIKNTRQRLTLKPKKSAAASPREEPEPQLPSASADTNSSAASDDGSFQAQDSIQVDLDTKRTNSVKADTTPTETNHGDVGGDAEGKRMLVGDSIDGNVRAQANVVSNRSIQQQEDGIGGNEDAGKRFESDMVLPAHGSAAAGSCLDVAAVDEVEDHHATMVTGVEGPEEPMDMDEDEKVSPVFGRCSVGRSDRKPISDQQPFESNWTKEDAVNSETLEPAEQASTSLPVPPPPNFLLLNDIDSISEGSCVVTPETFSETSGSHGDNPSPLNLDVIPESPEFRREDKRPKRLSRRKRKPDGAAEDEEGSGSDGKRETRSRKRGKTSAD